MILRDARQILLVSRPVSWINTAFPFAAAYFLNTGDLDPILVVGVLYFLIPYNMAMYGINDVFDYTSDLANPRKGGIEGALLQPRLHGPTLWAAVVTNLPLLALLVLWGSPASAAALAVSVFAVVAYSAPKLRFKERPFLDSMTSSTHFVSPAAVGLAMAGANMTIDVVLILVAFFLWGMAAHAFGAVQDVTPDRDAGIGSIATVLGARSTVRCSLALWALAGLAMLFVSSPGPLAALLVIPYLANAAPWAGVSDDEAAQVNAAWRRFIFLNYGAGFLATMIFILAWNM